MYLNLKLQLFKLGIHQNRLARKLGIDETALSKIINGYREPSETQRKQLADFLGVEEKWLFEKYDDAHRDREPILNVFAQPEGKDGLP
jgi:transcriptional regulator with XRE-family HTH domain